MTPDWPSTWSTRPRRGTYALAAAAAAVPGAIQGLASNQELFQGGLLNPDGAMRLVRLHDILAAGSPLHAVMRDGSGAGTLLHWSHLLDSLLLLTAFPLAMPLGWPAALHLMALMAGPAMLAGLGMAVVWAIAPLAPRGWAWTAAAAAGAAPGVMGYGLAGVLHHHVLLAVTATMACGWALRLLRGAPVRPGGLAMGAWAGAGLWLSPETLPFSLMALGALWLAWLVDPTRRLSAAMAWFGAGFTVVTVAAWAVDPPAAGWAAVEPDRLSLPFVLMAAATFSSGLVAWCSQIRRLALAYALGAACIWLLMMPQVLTGTEALVPHDVVAAMFEGIAEMNPVEGVRDALQLLLGGLFALGVLLVWAGRRPSLMQAYLLACCAGMVLLGALHIRFSTYPAVAGAALLPLAIGWVGNSRAAAGWQSLARVGMVLPLLLGPLLLPSAASAGPNAGAGASCRLSGAVALLRPFPDQVVLSGVNEVPELLYRTEIRTVGSLYHRSPLGFMRLRAAWRSIPAEDPGRLPGPDTAATGATLLLACPGAPRSQLVAGLPRTTLLDRVGAGQPPRWLERVGDAGPGGYVLYALRR